MSKKAAVAVLFAAFVAQVHAEPLYKDNNGRDCVTATGFERHVAGYVKLNFQNICDREFQVRVQPSKSGNVRSGGIRAGSRNAPAKMYLECKADAGCESGQWSYK